MASFDAHIQCSEGQWRVIEFGTTPSAIAQNLALVISL